LDSVFAASMVLLAAVCWGVCLQQKRSVKQQQQQQQQKGAQGVPDGISIAADATAPVPVEV
jgi:hypothetical protein